MGRNKRIHPLPEWFNLTKYDVFLDVKNEDIFYEIAARAIIYANADNPMSYLGDAIRVLESGDLFVGRAVRAGIAYSMSPDGHEHEPFVSALADPELARILSPVPRPETPPLAYGVSIHPLNGFGLRKLYTGLRDTGAIQRLPEDPPDQLRLNLGKMSASLTKTLDSKLIYVAIDPTKATNVEMILEFSELLPIWREQVEAPEPDKTEGDKEGGSLIKRIVEYKAIAMLDLELWSKYAKLKDGYSHPQLLDVLYPNEIVSEKTMSTTRRPFQKRFGLHDQQDRMLAWLGLIGRDGRYNRDRLVRDEFPPAEK